MTREQIEYKITQLEATLRVALDWITDLRATVAQLPDEKGDTQ